MLLPGGRVDLGGMNISREMFRHEMFRYHSWCHETFQPSTMGYWEIFSALKWAMKYLGHRNEVAKPFVLTFKVTKSYWGSKKSTITPGNKI